MVVTLHTLKVSKKSYKLIATQSIHNYEDCNGEISQFWSSNYKFVIFKGDHIMCSGMISDTKIKGPISIETLEEQLDQDIRDFSKFKGD